MIGYYVHHQGAGHLHRMRSISEHLPEPVWGLSSLEQPCGWAGPWLQLARDDTAVAHGGFGRDDRDPTASGTLHWVPRHHPGLARRTAQIAEWAATQSPALMVADVSVEAAMTARLCGIPTVVVAMPGQRDDPAHRLAYDSADALLAPWPREAHAHGWPERWVHKAWFVGGISRFDGLRPPPPVRHPDRPGTRSTRQRRVLVLWGAGGGALARNAVEEARRATPSWSWTVRAPGPQAATNLWRDLCDADVVVTHAGQNAVAEVAAAAKPAVIVAQPRPFDEQVATAAAVHRLGVAVGLSAWPTAQHWPQLLDQALDLGAAGWPRWSTGDGGRAAARHLTSLSAALAPHAVRCHS